MSSSSEGDPDIGELGLDRYEDDPSVCSCGNICSRDSGRGACPCKKAGKCCNASCSCGTKKMTCTNRSKEKAMQHRKGFEETSSSSTGTPILSFIDERSGDHTDSGTQTSPERVIRTPPRRKRKPVKRKHSLEREQPRGSQNMPSAPPDPERPTTPPAQERPAAPPAQEVLDEEEVHAFLDSQTEEDLRALLLDLLRRHPDEWDHLTGHPEGGEEQEAIPSDGESEGGPDWCHCGNCREMPTEVESVCCRRRNGPCVTAEQQFRSLILDPTALDLAMVQRYDLLALGDRADNTSYRYTAYRSYVYWKSGRTGRYNRIVIPSCAVWAIRDRFPSEDGHYTGFRIGRF